MDGVGKTYGDHVVFSNASLTIERGDKVAFVGKNGEGKSTLVKCIMKEIEHDGTLTLGHNVQIGYFAQNQASMLDENLTVFRRLTMWQKEKYVTRYATCWVLLCLAALNNP